MRVWLDNCSDEEIVILVAIAALAAELPRNLAAYAPALTHINRLYFGVQAPTMPDHNKSGKSVTVSRSVRASRRKWRGE